MSLLTGFINNTVICNEKKEVDLDVLNLLACGTVEELCRCSYKYEKGHHHFVYDTSDMIPLTRLQAGLSFENAVEILSCALKLVLQLSSNGLVLDSIKNAKEYIFKADNGYRFICIPIEYKSHLHVKDYFLRLLSVIHLKDIRINKLAKDLRKFKENEQVIAYLTRYIASYETSDTYSEDATSLLFDESETSLLGATVPPDIIQDGETSLLSDEGETSVLSRVADEGETTVLSQTDYDGEFLRTDTGSMRQTAYYHDVSSEYETTVLSASTQTERPISVDELSREFSLYLIRNINGEKISVDVTPFTIGKDSNNMDYVLNNESISRHHATIIYEEGNYFIMDNQSTNGTMIEGIKLHFEEKGEIGNGYIISLGNETFQACIERR